MKLKDFILRQEELKQEIEYQLLIGSPNKEYLKRIEAEFLKLKDKDKE